MKFDDIYIKGFEKELEVAAEMAGIDIKDAKTLLDQYYKALGYLIDDQRAPIINVHAWGVFKFSSTLVDRVLNAKTWAMSISDRKRKYYELFLKYVGGRLERENNKEVGVGFWWSLVPRDFVNQLMVKEGFNEDK